MNYAEVLIVNNAPVEVAVTRKAVKRLSLRLDKQGAPVLTVPKRTGEAELRAFLSRCVPWLEKNLRPRSFFLLPQELRQGDCALLFGQRRAVRLAAGKKAELLPAGEELLLRCPAPDDPAKAAAAYEKALRALASRIFAEALARWYPLIAARFSPPALSVKKMTSRWGSASPQRGHISMSLYLLKAPPSCIDYVALHETAHFLHPDHGAAFHALLDREMPDRKQREKALRELARS